MKILKGIFALFVITIVLNTCVMGFFEIDKYDIDATLMNNGDLLVYEKIQYTTNEYRNGVYRDISINNKNNKKHSSSKLGLYDVWVDDIEYSKVSTASNGQEGVYEYTTTDSETFRIKVFAPFRNVGRTVEYRYMLENVAIKYNDIGDLYWNFVGKEWEDKINNLNIQITLKGDLGPNDVYVFGHGSDNGKFEKIQNNVMLLSANNIAPGQAVDARIVFPSVCIAESKKIIDKDVLQDIIQEEKNKEKRIEQLMKFKEAFKEYQSEIALGSILVTILLVIYSYFKYDKEKRIYIKYFREIPYGLEPAILGRIYNGKSNGRHFWATFFDLVRKKIYNMEKVIDKKGKEQYIVKYIGENKNIVLKDFEEELITNINKCIKDDNEIEFENLNKAIKKRMQTTKSFINWEDTIKLHEKEIVGESKKTPMYIKLLSAFNVLITMVIILVYVLFYGGIEILVFIAIFYGITTIVYTLFIQTARITTSVLKFIFILIHFSGFQFALYGIATNVGAPNIYFTYLLAFLAFNYILKINKYTDKQMDIIAKLKGLNRYIKDFSMLKEKDIEYIALWQQYLIIAVMFGVSKKILKRLCDNLDIYDLDENYIATSYISNYSMFNSMGNQFSSSSYASSYSGSSGGFSGGGGRWWPEEAGGGGSF